MATHGQDPVRQATPENIEKMATTGYRAGKFDEHKKSTYHPPWIGFTAGSGSPSLRHKMLTRYG